MSSNKSVGNCRGRWGSWATRQARVRRAVQASGKGKGLRLAWAPGLSPEDLRTARYGLLISCHPGMARHRAAQARLAIGWSVGLRGHAEPAGLKRCDLTCESPTRVRLHLGRSKTDQEGRGHDFGLTFTPEDDPLVARAIQRWLAVWDSCTPAPGFDGPLFCSFTSQHGGDLRHGKARLPNSAQKDMKRLARFAGLPENWTLHSTRAGYARTLLEDGEELHEVSRALRHASVSSTARYITNPKGSPEESGKQVVSALTPRTSQ